MFGQSSKLAVSEEYIYSLVHQANGKMHSNWLRVQRFRDLLGQHTLHLSSAHPSAGKACSEAAAARLKPASLGQELTVPLLGTAVQFKKFNAAHSNSSMLQAGLQGHSAQHDVRLDPVFMRPSFQKLPMAGATKRPHAGLKASVVRRLRALERRQKAVLNRVAALEDTMPEPEAADRAWCWQQMPLSFEVGSLCFKGALIMPAVSCCQALQLSPGTLCLTKGGGTTVVWHEGT